MASNFKTAMTDKFANDGFCDSQKVAPSSKNVVEVATGGTAVDGGGCTITSTMSNNVSVDLKNKTLVLTLKSDGTINNWECTSSIPDKYLPKGCKSLNGATGGTAGGSAGGSAKPGG